MTTEALRRKLKSMPHSGSLMDAQRQPKIRNPQLRFFRDRRRSWLHGSQEERSPSLQCRSCLQGWTLRELRRSLTFARCCSHPTSFFISISEEPLYEALSESRYTPRVLHTNR